MTVGFKVGNIIDEVGTEDFLHSFFSTISYHLEPDGWGSRFPELMNELYQGRLSSEHAAKALADLRLIHSELSRLPPDKVIWDIQNLKAKPPWGSNISKDITDLGNYFVTSTGRDLFTVLVDCLQEIIRTGGSLEIVPV